MPISVLPGFSGVVAMTHNLYITGAEQGSGKSVIVLAVMELLTGYAEKIGIFRPVVRSTPQEDNLLRLLTTRYQLITRPSRFTASTWRRRAS